MVKFASRRLSVNGCKTAGLVLAIMLPLTIGKSASAEADIKNKIVLANVSRFPVTIRVGATKKTIEAGKASMMSPKRYPVSLEYWDGHRRRPQWQKLTANKAGIHKFHFRGGRWQAVEHVPRADAPRPTVTRSSSGRPPGYRRSTGTRTRVIRSGRHRTYNRNYYSRRMPALSRVLRPVFLLYRYCPDEIEHELFWRYIIGEEIDDAVRDEIERELDKLAENLPADELREFEQSMDELQGMSDQDWQQLDNLTDEDWDQAQELVGDNVDPELFDAVKGDIDNLDLGDLPETELADVGDTGVENIGTDIELGDLGDVTDVDLGDFGGAIDNIDVGDLAADIQDFDLGDTGIAGDFGGGFEGGWDAGAFDFGGAMDYGGFDSFGGAFDGFGGGLNDFGGAGVGDFDGGFDDFGGGFDVDF